MLKLIQHTAQAQKQKQKLNRRSGVYKYTHPPLVEEIILNLFILFHLLISMICWQFLRKQSLNADFENNLNRSVKVRRPIFRSPERIRCKKLFVSSRDLHLLTQNTKQETIRQANTPNQSEPTFPVPRHTKTQQKLRLCILRL